jgi:hypothetical protein
VSEHKHITEPDSGGFQVRVVRDRKEYSRYFSHNLWGSKNKSLKGAINWREQILVLIGDKKPTPIGKKSTGIVGVSRTVQFDKRRDEHSLVYSCHWRRNGKGHTKTFHVGLVENVTPDMEFHAFRTAVQFRKEYEFYKDRGKIDFFMPERYKLWRTERLYGAQPN